MYPSGHEILKLADSIEKPTGIQQLTKPYHDDILHAAKLLRQFVAERENSRPESNFRFPVTAEFRLELLKSATALIESNNVLVAVPMKPGFTLTTDSSYNAMIESAEKLIKFYLDRGIVA